MSGESVMELLLDYQHKVNNVHWNIQNEGYRINMNQYVLFCTIICIIFTSLYKKLVKFTWVLAEAFQVSLTRFLQSEVKIIHIVVQDQDGQNNNMNQ